MGVVTTLSKCLQFVCNAADPEESITASEDYYLIKNQGIHNFMVKCEVLGKTDKSIALSYYPGSSDKKIEAFLPLEKYGIGYKLTKAPVLPVTPLTWKQAIEVLFPDLLRLELEGMPLLPSRENSDFLECFCIEFSDNIIRQPEWTSEDCFIDVYQYACVQEMLYKENYRPAIELKLMEGITINMH